MTAKISWFYAAVVAMGMALPNVCWAKRYTQNPCESTLTFGRDFYFSSQAHRSLRRLRLSPDKIDDILYFSKGDLVQGENWGERYYIAFSYINGADRGYKVTLQQLHSRVPVVADIQSTTLWQEREYFTAIAALDQLHTEYFPLKTPILGCKHVEVVPAVQAKLERKHQLSLKDVINAFNKPFLQIKHEDPDRYPFKSDRYSLLTRLSDGQLLHLVVSPVRKSTRLHLITAYVEHLH